MPSVSKLPIMLSVVMLSIVILSDVILSDVMLSVVTLNVLSPLQKLNDASYWSQFDKD
jgi:hypothetical protein